MNAGHIRVIGEHSSSTDLAEQTQFGSRSILSERTQFDTRCQFGRTNPTTAPPIASETEGWQCDGARVQDTRAYDIATGEPITGSRQIPWLSAGRRRHWIFARQQAQQRLCGPVPSRHFIPPAPAASFSTRFEGGYPLKKAPDDHKLANRQYRC
jgi:hypothetical protein